MAIQLQDTGRVTGTLCKDMCHVYRDMFILIFLSEECMQYADNPQKERGKKQL